MTRSRASSSPARRNLGVAVLAALASLVATAGCTHDSTRPDPARSGIPQASYEGQLDPGTASFVLTRLQVTPSGREPVEVELIGSNLAVESSTETVSLDVSLRNASPVRLPNPAQVWLGGFRPAGVEVLNAEYPDPPIRTLGMATPAGPTRFGFDYSSLVGPDEVLSPGESSQAKTWQFRVPGLASFTFAATATFGGAWDGPVISGLVYHDLDGDGARDPEEPPFAGGLSLSRPDGTVEATSTTDGGTYSFRVQDIGMYTLAITPPAPNCLCDVIVTTPNPLRVMLLPDEQGQPQSYTHADFGLRIVWPAEPVPVVLTDLTPDLIRQDPYRMEVVDFSGDLLALRVGFSGCTPDHDFPLYMSGGFLESDPVQARLVLGHDDHGEPCDATFERVLRFDLTPVRVAYERTYGQPGPVVLQLTDLQGNHYSFRYVWAPPLPGNLLPNGSFEFEGQPTLRGWAIQNPGLTSVVPGDAPDGGRWALRLEADWAPTTGLVRAPVVGIAPGQPLRLSAWVRADGDQGGGMIYLASGTWISEPARSDDAQWTRIEWVGAPPIGPSDTLWVVLSSLHAEIARRAGLFDGVVLTPVVRRDGSPRAGATASR